MARQYRIGVIGVGNMGVRYLRELHASPRWEIAWACDLNPRNLDRARVLVPGLVTGDDAEALLRQSELDVQ